MDRKAELELVARVRAGDIDAFDAAYGQFNGRLLGFLTRLARNRDVAEDLLEETWVRFVTHANRLAADTRLGPWLFAVARNLHVSYCRARVIETSHAEAGIGLWPAVRPNSPFETAAGSELGRRLDAALASLPIAFREVLLLVGVEGLQPAEAAVVCGVSPAALRQRLRRARAMLEDRLGERRPSHSAREVHHAAARSGPAS